MKLNIKLPIKPKLNDAAPSGGNVAVKSKGKERHRIVSLDKKKARIGWLFVLPFVLGFALIYIPIIFDSINLSFREITYISGGGYDTPWVGFANYQSALFDDTSFVQTLKAGIKELIFEVPAIIFFSLFVAILLNEKMAGRAAFRAIFFIPVVLSTGLIAQIDASNSVNAYMDSGSIDTGSSTNSVSEIISAVDIQNLFSNMMVGSEIATRVVALVNNIFDIVNRSGVQMLIFLAGLQSISPAIYESCTIEGASAWETFWKITFPMISPMILVNAVYTIIDSFTAESNSVMQYIKTVYETGGSGQVVSSAMSWMYFLLVILIVAACAGLISVFVFYQRRD